MDLINIEPAALQAYYTSTETCDRMTGKTSEEMQEEEEEDEEVGGEKCPNGALYKPS